MANKIALWAWHLVAAHIFALYSQHLLVNILPEKTNSCAVPDGVKRVHDGSPHGFCPA